MHPREHKHNKTMKHLSRSPSKLFVLPRFLVFGSKDEATCVYQFGPLPHNFANSDKASIEQLLEDGSYVRSFADAATQPINHRMSKM
jgi:hypothetical protein